MQNTIEQNKDFLDLYGDALKEVIHLTEPPTFETIKAHFPKFDEMERAFEWNGKRIFAKRKLTFTGGRMYQVKTNYLHVSIEQESKQGNLFAVHRETKTGSFKFINYEVRK